MPLVSVIIPAFNRAHLLARAVRSVLNQTMGDWECIVVDDASTDKTEELLAQPELSRSVRCIRFPLHRGVSAARNAGVAAAKGAWLAFLDSDDEWHAAKLEKQLQWHKTSSAFRISQTKEFWVRRGTRVTPPPHARKKTGIHF